VPFVGKLVQKLALIGRHPVPLGVAGGEGQDEWAEFEHKPKVRSVSSAQQDDAKCIAGAVVGLVSDVVFVKQRVNWWNQCLWHSKNWIKGH